MLRVGLRERRFLRGGLRLLAAGIPARPPLRPVRWAVQGVSAIVDPARAGGSWELPAGGPPPSSFVFSPVCWVPVFFILLDFSSFLEKGWQVSIF